MKTVLIRDISKFENQRVTIHGWIIHSRPSGKLVFSELRDGTGFIQCVFFKGDLTEDEFENAKMLSLETAISIEGVIRRDERSKYGYEIGVQKLKILHRPDDDYPISPKEHGVAFLLEHRHLWLRSTRQQIIQSIRSDIMKYAREYLDKNGFFEFNAPILTPVACEGTTTLFETEYFDESAYLTQSGQLYDEAGAFALGRVYSFGPTFRAEKSKTRRHLTEFWMIEPEAAFFDLDQVMDLAENFVAYIIDHIVDKHRTNLLALDRDLTLLENVKKPFPRISYDDAIKILKDNNADISWGDDFGAEHETILSNQFGCPIFVHRYPAKCKAFYMKNDPNNKDLALCVDMLAPEGYGEIIGGGQREDNFKALRDKITKHNLDPKSFNWYLDLRKYGSVPHGGFGLGIERFVAWICGLHHVRETIPFPRMLERIWP